MPIVSVVMPTYNQVKFLEESVRSVLGQTFTDFELIIINDGSVDNTYDYLATLGDRRIRIMHQNNQGASASMNRGFSEATGEYLTWIASDNLYKPQFLERALARITANDRPGLVYGCFENIDEQGKFLDYVFSEAYFPGLLLENPSAVGIAFLYTRKVCEKVGEYVNLVCNDLDYWLRTAREFTFAFIPEVLASNRKHPGMQTVIRRNELLSQVDELLEKERRFCKIVQGGMAPILREVGRWTQRLNRALSARGCLPGEEILLVGNRGADCEKVEKILAGEGYRVSKRIPDTSEMDSVWKFPLDFESEKLLAGKKKVVTLMAPSINV